MNLDSQRYQICTYDMQKQTRLTLMDRQVSEVKDGRWLKKP